MAETLFRKKNLDRIKDPDTLDKYIQVANPGGWVLLAAILCLLIGVLIWGAFGKIETKVQAHAYVESETAILEVSEDEISSVESGMIVRIGDAEGTVFRVTPSEKAVIVKIDVPDGAYDAVIITETIRPMSLIFD